MADDGKILSRRAACARLALLAMTPHAAVPVAAADADPGAFRQRGDALLAWVADRYVLPGSGGRAVLPQPAAGVPDPQKYVYPRALARLARDPKDPWARGVAAQFALAGGDPAPHEGSFYHFAAYGFARLLLAFPEVVPGDLRAEFLKRAMTEEQLFAGQGTENHIAMWRTSGFLFAQEAGNASRLAAMRDWVRDYRRRLLAVGQGEWDSSTYATFDIASWLNLLDLARDEGVRADARAVTEEFCRRLARKYAHGALAGAEKRGFCGGSADAIAAYTGWLWFGDCPEPADDAFFSQNAIYSVVPALSRFRPDAETLALARKSSWKSPRHFVLRHPDYAMTRAAEATETLTCGPRWSVGASVASPVGGWGGGDTQETLWKFVARGVATRDGAWVLGGAGASYAARNRYGGGGRGPWDQVARHDDLLLQLTRVPENAAALTEEARVLFDAWRRTGNEKKVSWADPVAEPWAYAALPAGARLLEEGGIAFLEMPCAEGGASYAALTPISGAYQWKPGAESPKGRRVAITSGRPGEVVGFAWEFGDDLADRSFDAFRAAVLARAAASRLRRDGVRIALTGRSGGTTLEATFGTSGTYAEPQYDWGPQPKWPAGEGHGRVPEIRVNGKPVRALTSR